MVLTRRVILGAICLHICCAAPLAAEVQNTTTFTECKGKEVYWDSERGTCNDCTLCQSGWGSTHNCGSGSGRRATCRECKDGVTFQSINGSSERCKPCTTCDGQIIEANCTTMHDNVCGSCKDGFGRHPGKPELCSLCKLFNDHEQPPECQKIHPTGASLSSFPGGHTSSAPLEDQGRQFPVWVVPVVVVFLVLVAAIIGLVWYVRSHRRSNPTTGSEQNTTNDISQVHQTNNDSSNNDNNGLALANSGVRQEEKEVFIEIHDNPTEMSTLLASSSDVEKTTHLSIDEAGQDDRLVFRSLKNQPIQEEPNNESERPIQQRTPLEKIPTRPMVDSEKPKVMRRRFFSDGEMPCELSNTQQLTPEVRNKCKKDERTMKEKEFENTFQKACSYGRKIHWKDLEPGTRKTCTQLMTPDRSSSNDFRTLGDMLELKPQTHMKECSNLEEVFAMLHKIGRVLVDMEEVLLKLREMRRMDVVRVVVDEIIKKKPTCKCVS